MGESEETGAGRAASGSVDRRRVLLAVSGGIAAYKVPELVRALRRSSCEVRCVLTSRARHFVAPLVLQTLSGESVRWELFDPQQERALEHIELADWAELVIVAPATANLLAKMAHGVADDLVSTLLLATRAPVLVAPAMNVHMWQHPATQCNLELLRDRGVRTVGPLSGELACGWHGEGRMASPDEIVESSRRLLCTSSLSGERILVTAGGTVERIDDARSLTNRSSGRMGFAVAEEAARRGGCVTLVSGPATLPTPPGVRRIDVESALEMHAAVRAEIEAARVLVMAAAVADFRPHHRHSGKIKKEELSPGEGLSLELVRNPDILQEICARKGERVVVGFAAESGDVEASARRKLERKGCDLLIANDISRSDAGFDVDANQVLFVWPGGETESLPLLPKREVAAHLLDRVEKLLAGRG